ncbi:S8 family serine peptidase [candidate division KSB1 bacterium]|nr:S8 family serine peptidase [candidate division KSB1 bacterium]
MNRLIEFIWAMLSIFFGVVQPLLAQAPVDWKTARILEGRIEPLHREYLAAKELAVLWARENSLPVRHDLGDGRTIELERLESGLPRYVVNFNLSAARSIAVDRLWDVPETHLDGDGITVAIWDVGSILANHQEFGRRVVQMDELTLPQSHSTLVAGTLMAQGIDPEARGMAPGAQLHVYNWNDDLAEMTLAARRGLLLSNHSYGPVGGWIYNYKQDGRWAWLGDSRIDENEDYRFGFYDRRSAQIDQLANDASYYLIVRAAGNDRNDFGAGTNPHWVWDFSKNEWVLSTRSREPDGDFDCLISEAVSKNVLTIGAISDLPHGYVSSEDVAIASYSSWGPTDDGRIKPDLVATGSALYSTSNQSTFGYGFYSGTSAAAPCVTGALALLQQYTWQNKAHYLDSATLKALLIHTANEAGPNSGPDYAYGWGVVNIKAVFDLLVNDRQAQVYWDPVVTDEQPFVLQGLGDPDIPLRATAVWTDPPGEPPAVQLNPRTPMLINDLDLRIVESHSGAVVLPWCLDGENPSAPAYRGDNKRDNVEQVELDYTATGIYRIVLQAKSPLFEARQSAALIVTGLRFGRVLQVRALLEGARDGQRLMMRTALSAGDVLPKISPFGDGAEKKYRARNTVDWVQLEFLDADDGKPIFRQSLLIDDRGVLRDPESGSAVLPLQVEDGEYRLRLRHRNHLPVLSGKVNVRADEPLFVDFTSSSSLNTQPIGAKRTGGGIWVAAVGDVDGDGAILAPDYISVRQAIGRSGYLPQDLDQNGTVDNADLNLYFRNQGHFGR